MLKMFLKNQTIQPFEEVITKRKDQLFPLFEERRGFVIRVYKELEIQVTSTQLWTAQVTPTYSHYYPDLI